MVDVQVSHGMVQSKDMGTHFKALWYRHDKKSTCAVHAYRRDLRTPSRARYIVYYILSCTLVYSTLLYSTLLYSTLLHYTLPYSTILLLLCGPFGVCALHVQPYLWVDPGFVPCIRVLSNTRGPCSYAVYIYIYIFTYRCILYGIT